MRAISRIIFASLATTSLLVACGDASRDESGQIQSAGAIDAFAMRVGDCFNDSFFQQEEVSDVSGVPCTDPHDNEVYALFDIESASWPGQEQVDSLAEEGCFLRFQGAIGASYQESVLMFTTLYPTEESWTRMNDREVICVAYHMETEKLTGSVLQSGM